MKITILTQLFPPKWLGGAEIAAYNIAKNLVQNGHEVQVITLSDQSFYQKREEAGFIIHQVPQLKTRFLGVIIFWLKILFLLKKINPEIIHVQSIAIGVPAFLAKKIFKKPYIVYCRGSDVYLPWPRKSLISSVVLRNADSVIALTEDMKRKIQEIWGIKTEVIPNGIVVERFKGLSKEDGRLKFGFEKEEKIIIFVGTLKKVKGIKYLIEAMNIVVENNPEAKLILIGDGEEKEELKKIVQELNLGEKVTFLGRKFNEEIPGYMVASDVFVLPSLSEGFPVTILEAMAAGLPIIATKVGGVPEIIKENDNGFLVEPQNSLQIAEKILLLFQNENLRQKISQNNQEKAKNYSWSEVVKNLEKVYNHSII